MQPSIVRDVGVRRMVNVDQLGPKTRLLGLRSRRSLVTGAEVDAGVDLTGGSSTSDSSAESDFKVGVGAVMREASAVGGAGVKGVVRRVCSACGSHS